MSEVPRTCTRCAASRVRLVIALSLLAGSTSCSLGVGEVDDARTMGVLRHLFLCLVLLNAPAFCLAGRIAEECDPRAFGRVAVTAVFPLLIGLVGGVNILLPHWREFWRVAVPVVPSCLCVLGLVFTREPVATMASRRSRRRALRS